MTINIASQIMDNFVIIQAIKFGAISKHIIKVAMYWQDKINASI